MRNSHDIAICLENHLRKRFNINFRPRGTIFDADSIELYSFYDVINLLLTLYGHGDFIDFLNKIYEYKNSNMNKIPNLENLYEEFSSFYIDD